jgi:hypothetical protein
MDEVSLENVKVFRRFIKKEGDATSKRKFAEAGVTTTTRQNRLRRI